MNINELPIKEASKQISNNFRDKYLDLKNELSKSNLMIEDTVKEFKIASAQGDHSENAAYIDAKDKLTKLSVLKVYILKDLEDMEQMLPDSKYVPSSYIGFYSTFRIKCLDGSEEITTWKVYPNSIYSIVPGVLSVKSYVYPLFCDKEVGDIVETINRASGEHIKYVILDIY